MLLFIDSFIKKVCYRLEDVTTFLIGDSNVTLRLM